MTKIQAETTGAKNERVLLSLTEFLRRGMSWEICRAAHAWPPLTTFHAFVRQGVDDVADGSILRWTPFEVTKSEYETALACIDPEFRIEGLCVASDDWKGWFLAAVDLGVDR